jgi:hypothetical protein
LQHECRFSPASALDNRQQMKGLNFSANGTRWRVVILTRDMAAEQHTPPLPGTGLLFTADDGSTRFLPLELDVIPSIEELQRRTNEELGSLAERASAWPVKQHA